VVKTGGQNANEDLYECGHWGGILPTLPDNALILK
jgi:hypothetical protein